MKVGDYPVIELFRMSNRLLKRSHGEHSAFRCCVAICYINHYQYEGDLYPDSQFRSLNPEFEPWRYEFISPVGVSFVGLGSNDEAVHDILILTVLDGATVFYHKAIVYNSISPRSLSVFDRSPLSMSGSSYARANCKVQGEQRHSSCSGLTKV